MNNRSQAVDLCFICPFQETVGGPVGNGCVCGVRASLETESLRFVEVHCMAIFL